MNDRLNEVTERPNSLASSLMMGVVLYHNKPGLINKVEAEFGFILIFAVACIETVAATVLVNLCLLMAPCARSPLRNCSKWLSSSAFTMLWSLADIFLNVITIRMIADERSARRIAFSGRLMTIPSGALV